MVLFEIFGVSHKIKRHVKLRIQATFTQLGGDSLELRETACSVQLKKDPFFD
jgi:hypothetical protein